MFFGQQECKKLIVESFKKKCCGNFDIWLDGGHNDHAASMISNFIKNWSDLNKILILGMTAGKNPIGFLEK